MVRSSGGSSPSWSAVAGRAVSVDTLLQAIYGEDASPSSRATLHTYVSNLRHVLGDVIVRQGDAYLLDCTDATIDAALFEQAYRDAIAMDVPTTSPRGCATRWRCGAAIPTPTSRPMAYLDGEITRLSELRLAALEARIDADMRAGRHREVVAELDALTVEHPYREHLRAMHMLALYRSRPSGRGAPGVRPHAGGARRRPRDRPVSRAARSWSGASSPRTVTC